jgi:hypothetical protein
LTPRVPASTIDRKEDAAMADPVLELFAWITPVMEDPAAGDLPLDATEREIFEAFRDGWAVQDTPALLHGLTTRWGPRAAETIEKVLAPRITSDWREAGAKEARPGTEIEDFTRVLWDPLVKLGFAFTWKDEDGARAFRVTRCPVKELADRFDLHDWLYHLACASDLSSTPAFSPRLELTRTRLLIRGDDCCDHAYAVREP